MKTVYYVKQFGFYYGGRDPDGAFIFSPARELAVAFISKDAADKLIEKIGEVECEIEERHLGG